MGRTRWVVVSTRRVVGDMDEAIAAAVDHSLSLNMATVISHDGRQLVTVKLPPKRGGIDYKESHAREAEEVRR